MNSREFSHERFEELCALSALGQISPEEFRELQVHLQTCATCRLRQADFTEILHEHLPLLAPLDSSVVGSRKVAFHDASYKQRFIQRARQEGIVFSSEVTGEKKPRQALGGWAHLAWLWQPKRLAYSMALLGLGFWLGSQGARHMLKVETSSPELARIKNDNASLKQEIKELTTQKFLVQSERSLTQPQTTVAAVNSEIEKKLSQARQDYASATARSQALDEQLQKASAELASLREETDKLRSESPRSAKLKETEAALQRATDELQKLQRERSVYASTFADQQTQIRELMEKLGNQTASIERERELTAAGRDIRELMGARNLHIIDLADVDSGGSQRPFGRVFYTEGKSLIFYAYDLEKKRKSLEKYSFQAWGQREAKGGPAQSLGVFVSDDQGQSRWVLKYDNPKVLAQIDAVFVTIEPKGGSERPQGQQLLYAYLKANPNHP
ncbi:MAG: hypothetical protein L0387_18280 [Acidobacteria bacterium]|nr:hypothetical protein [Acidobacteriota bacterium]MCI0623577.1 hypothetical protein [Acidobacteriota bacterium]MCI0723077.1 hypothetical protein [Acidobacteriota bacterium]